MPSCYAVNPDNLKAQITTSDLIDDKIARRLRDEALLRESHQQLEKRIADSTRDLAESNIRLLREITERREAEEELRRAYDRNELLLESAGEGIYGVDTEGRCTFANRAATKMLGFAREELLGTDVRSLLHADRASGEPIAADDWVVLRVMQTAEGVRVEDEMMVRRDGTQFCADKGVTRGQMAAFLVRAFGLSDDGGGDLFDDDNDSIFENDIDKLATAEITLGCNPPANTNFCPDKTVTRGQMAAFLHRANNL